MEKITTATGKTFDSDYFTVLPFPSMVFLRILNTPLAKVAEIFSLKEETVQLWCGDAYLAHYTRLAAIIPEGDAVKVSLAKE